MTRPDQQLSQDIDRGQFCSVYFFYGPEEFLKEQAVQRIIASQIPPGLRDFNLDILYGDEAQVAEIIDRVSSLPMMAERRVVVVRDAQRISPGDRRRLLEHCMPAQRKKQLDQSDADILEQIKRLKCTSLDRKSEKDVRRKLDSLLKEREVLVGKTGWAFADTILILTAGDVKAQSFFQHLHSPGKCEPGEKARKLKKSEAELISWHSFFAQRAICQVQFRDLWEREIPSWVKQTAKQYGKAIDPEAVRSLTDSIGTDLVAMDNELRKLAIYVGETSVIEKSDVEAVVGEFRTRTVFEFCDAVGTGDLATSIALLVRLLEAGVSPFHIIGTLRWHLGQLAVVRAMRQKKKPRDAMAREMRIWRGYVDKYVRQSSRFDEPQLEQAFEHLFRTELELKTSSSKHKTAMTLLVHHLCRPGGEEDDGWSRS